MPPVWRGDPTRFQGGVLMDETFSPLPPSDSVLLFQRAASPIRPLSLNTSSSGDASVLIPYLPDYGSDLSLTVPKRGAGVFPTAPWTVW